MHHNPGFSFLARFELANGVTHTPVLVETDMPIRGGEVYFLPGDKGTVTIPATLRSSWPL